MPERETAYFTFYKLFSFVKTIYIIKITNNKKEEKTLTTPFILLIVSGVKTSTKFGPSDFRT